MHKAVLTRKLKSGATLLLVACTLALSGCGLVMSDEDRLDRAEQAIADGEFRAAIIDAKDVLQGDPGNVRGRLLLGRASISIGDASSAEKELRRAIELGTDLSIVAVDLGRALVALEQYDQLIEEITTDLARSDEDRLRILQLRGDALLGLGQPESARDLYTQILDVDSLNVDARLGIVGSYLEERNYVQARATVDHVLTTSDDSVQPWLVSGRMYLDRRNAQLAETHFDRALSLAVAQDSLPAEVQALGGLGEALLAQEKTDRARTVAERFMTLAPNAPPAVLLSARIAYIDRNWERAEALLQDVLRRAPNFAPAQLMLGSLHLQNGNLELAEMYLSAVVAADSNNADARNLLAQARLRQNDVTAAQELLQPMLDSVVPNANALTLAAQVSAGAGDFEQATQYLERRVEVSIDDPQAKLDLAAIYLMGNRTEDAQAILKAGDFADSDANAFRRDMLLVLSKLRSEDAAAALEEARAVAEKWPESPRALSLRAAVEMFSGDAGAARESLTAATNQNPNDLLSLRLLGVVEEDEGNYAAATSSYLKIVDLAPNDLGGLLALARISARVDDLRNARHWLERAVAADPNNFNVRRTLGQILLAQRDFEAAKEFAEESIRLSSNSAASHRLLGHAFLNLERHAEAEESFKQAIALDPSVSEYWLSLARTQIGAGDRDAAYQTISDAYAQNPEDVGVAVLLAQLLVSRDDDAGAMVVAKDLRSARSDSAVPITIEAELLARQGELKKAAALYDAALAIENTPRLAARASQLRRAAGVSNQLEPLIDYLEENPLNANVRLFLAQNYQVDGADDMAVREYQRVLEIAPENSIALNNMAWMYHETGDARAEEFARKAYEVAPDNAQVVDTLGWILLQKGEVDEGAKLLQSAAEQLPDRPEIQYHLAAAQVKLGKRDDARRILEDLLREGGVFSSREEAEELLLQL